MSTERKRAPTEGERPNKRPKADAIDPAQNPYLAHHYEQPKSNGNGNETILSTFKRHQTTAELASMAEDGPENPMNGKPLSKNYFKILQSRRNLPVHAQR